MEGTQEKSAGLKTRRYREKAGGVKPRLSSEGRQDAGLEKASPLKGVSYGENSQKQRQEWLCCVLRSTWVDGSIEL
jgi:hypothetical protein